MAYRKRSPFPFALLVLAILAVGLYVSAALGFVGVAAGFCGAALAADRRINFTEYWPAQPAERTITVKIDGGPVGTGGGRLGILEGSTGLICDVDNQGPPKTCVWNVPAGQQLTLIPFFDEAWTSIQWIGAPCSSSNTGTGPQECVQTPSANVNVELRGSYVPLQ